MEKVLKSLPLNDQVKLLLLVGTIRMGKLILKILQLLDLIKLYF